MDLAKELLAWGAGLGLTGTMIAYSITFVTSKSHERRLQRRELQYLYNLLVFIVFVIVFPFFVALEINKDDHKLKNILIDFGLNNFLVLLIIQLILSLYVATLNNYLLNRLSSRKIIVTSLKWFNFLILIYTLLFSFLMFTDIVITYQDSDATKEEKIFSIYFVLLFYLILYVPYYIGFIGMIKTKTLVTVYLKDGKILTNLYLSHRSFGNNLILYDSQDKMQSKAVTIPKDSIQMIMNVECYSEKKIVKSQQDLDEFASRILIKESDKEQ